MTTTCENQFKESQSGLIEAKRRTTQLVKHRQQKQSGCEHTNETTDDGGTSVNFQRVYIIRNNSMIQHQQSTNSRYTYNYAADMYDSIDIYILISHESRGGNMQQSVVGSHTSEVVNDTKSPTTHSRYSITLTTEKTEMCRQTQTDQSSERSSVDNPVFMKAVKTSAATKRILEIFISNNTTD